MYDFSTGQVFPSFLPQFSMYFMYGVFKVNLKFSSKSSTSIYLGCKIFVYFIRILKIRNMILNKVRNGFVVGGATFSIF